jgi:hypothetical protein
MWPRERGVVSRRPPTELARIRLFLASVDEYEDLAAAMPRPEEVSLIHRAEPATRWTSILHAMVLRKYYTRDDELALGKVIGAIETCLTGRPAAFDGWKAARLEDVDYQRKHGSPWRVVTPEGGEERGFGDLAFDDLYGGLLHGDWDRWQRRNVGSAMADHVIWDWCIDAAGLVRMIRGQIDASVASGELLDPAEATAPPESAEGTPELNS